MTTYHDDSLVLNLLVGRQVIPLVKVGLEWPPPERLYLGPGGVLRPVAEGERPGDGMVLVQTRRSVITDEQRDTMTHVFRGAEYDYERP